MTTLFDQAAYQDILRRLDSLHPASPRQWGKMTVAQMLEHTARVLEMAAGTKPRKQIFIGKAISWAFRKNFLGPDPFGKNRPTGPEYVITHEPELDHARDRVKSILAHFHSLGEEGCDGHTHAFFGKLTGREWGTTQHKHLDHHLRQFGA